MVPVKIFRNMARLDSPTTSAPTHRAVLMKGAVMVIRAGGTTVGPSFATTQRSAAFNPTEFGKRLAVCPSDPMPSKIASRRPSGNRSRSSLSYWAAALGRVAFTQ